MKEKLRYFTLASGLVALIVIGMDFPHNLIYLYDGIRTGFPWWISAILYPLSLYALGLIVVTIFFSLKFLPIIIKGIRTKNFKQAFEECKTLLFKIADGYGAVLLILLTKLAVYLNLMDKPTDKQAEKTNEINDLKETATNVANKAKESISEIAVLAATVVNASAEQKKAEKTTDNDNINTDDSSSSSSDDGSAGGTD